MYINKLFLKEYGKFNNTEIKLTRGLNVICGAKESGKTTVRDFITDMLFGSGKGKGLSNSGDTYRTRKPHGGNGYFGKAQITKDGKEHLLERNFHRPTNGALLTDIESGKEEHLVNMGSYRGVLYDMDRSAYVDAMNITSADELGLDDRAAAAGLGKSLLNIKNTGNSGVNRDAAIEYLRNERRRYDNTRYLMQMEDLEAQMDELGDVDKELEDIRQARKDELDAYNIEIARLKREARQLINEEDAAIPDEDEDRERSRIFLEVEALPDEAESKKKEKKFTDNIWVIMATGILVVAIITAVVHFVGFQKSIQQLFTICTIAFVAITIIDGLFRNGVFDMDNVPTDEEFRRTVYEMGRATESRTVRIEVDREFQEAHDGKLDMLKFREHDAIEKRDAYYDLKEKRDAIFADYDALETQKKAIDEAIELISRISGEVSGRFADIDDEVSKMLAAISGGVYTEAKLDDEMHIAVKKGDRFFRVEFMGHEVFRQAYLAVRLSIAKLMNTDNMPLVIDDAIRLSDHITAAGLAKAVRMTGAEQAILLTSDAELAAQLAKIERDITDIITIGM